MLNELKWKTLSGAGAIIWIIDSVLWKIHNCGSIMSAITANGEFSNEGQIKRKPSMFYISVVASISTVIESMPVHTYLGHMLIFVLVSKLGSGGILLQGLCWDRARNSKRLMGFNIFYFSLRWERRSACPYPLPPTLILLSHPEFPSFSSSGALRNKLFRMEGGGHRCDHLLHVSFFSWAFKKALHILKRRRKTQWPLVLLSTDTAGAARGWQGVIFYRLATRRLLQWYSFFFFSSLPEIAWV